MKKLFLFLTILLISSCEIYIPTSSNDDVYYTTPPTDESYQGGLYYSFYNPYSFGYYYNPFGFYPYYYNNCGFTFFRYPFNYYHYSNYNFHSVYAPRTNNYGTLSRTSLGRIPYHTYNRSYNKGYQNYNYNSRGSNYYRSNGGGQRNYGGKR